MYRYFYICTDCYDNTWNTADVEKYIESTGYFHRDGAGSYSSNNFFCSIQIMRVNNRNGWSSNDYDSKSANYISIVINDKVSDLRKHFLKELSSYLGFRIIEDT